MMAQPVNKLRVFVPSIAGRWGGEPNPEGGRGATHPANPSEQSSPKHDVESWIAGGGCVVNGSTMSVVVVRSVAVLPSCQQPGSIIRVVVDRMTLCPQLLHLKITAKTVQICMFRWMLVGFWCVLDPLGVGRMRGCEVGMFRSCRASSAAPRPPCRGCSLHQS